jgi:hypothetical protein
MLAPNATVVVSSKTGALHTNGMSKPASSSRPSVNNQ